MLNLLEWALKNVGLYDIRAKDGKDLIVTLNQFAETSAVFDRDIKSQLEVLENRDDEKERRRLMFIFFFFS